jgi:membrane-bound lytic murein transglycosylase D
VATLRRHNPALRDSVWSGAKRVPKGFELRVPRGRLEKPLETLITEVPDAARFASQTRDTYHTIQRGETLSGIAARYEVSLSELAALNGLRSRHRIRAGQRLRLPEDATGRPAPRAARIAQAPPEASTEGTYQVRQGDTLERIARVFGVSERDLLGWNQIRNPNRIAVGQTLRVQDVPDDGEPAIVASEPVVVASVQPDHPDLVAAFTPPPGARAEFGADSGADEADEPGIDAGDDDLAAEDAGPLADDALTDAADESDEGGDAAEGESDATIGASVADAAAAELAQGSPAAEMLLADPGDYSVASDGTIEIQAAETLGHYAEWLDVRASRLRAINHMRYGTPLAIGARLKLDLSRVSPQLFEQRRADHHRTLQGEFFDRYEIEGTAIHVVRRGDSIWQLAERRYDVPLWLVRQYNPDVDFADLHTGEHLTIPVLHEK